MNLEEIFTLIERLYGASLDQRDWQEVVRHVASTFYTDSCVIHTRSRYGAQVTMIGTTGNVDAGMRGEYEEHYFAHDLWVAHYPKDIRGRPMIGADLVPPREMLGTAYYNDWMRRAGQYHILYSLLDVQPGIIGAIGIHRGLKSAEFGDDEKRSLTILLPHLARALSLNRHLGGLMRDRHIALDLLERLSAGVIAVDAQACILFANTPAERLLSGGAGLAVRNNRVVAADVSQNAELSRLIRLAAAAGVGRSAEAGKVLALRRPDGGRTPALVSPLPPAALGEPGRGPCAMIFISDNNGSKAASQRALADFYGVTPAEARLIEALSMGERLQDYSERHAISLHTAKTQLQHVFAKTGHGRQADLIRDVLTNQALRAVGPGAG